jgi:release factor glutamine methyltransferase
VKEKRHLLAHVLQQPVSQTYLNPTLSESEQAEYEALVARLDEGEPLAYLLGSAEFWSLSFKVTPEVLIPRPETELLVEKALAIFPVPGPIKVLELGTGSGAISIALKKERPYWEILAIDKSPTALLVAKENARQNAVALSFLESDWFHAISPEEKFDLIVSNPPYLANNDPHLEGSIRYEPSLALVSGKTGLEALKRIIQESQHFLNPSGKLLLEHGYDQGTAVQTLLRESGYKDIQTFEDVFGNDRVSGGQLYTPSHKAFLSEKSAAQASLR